MNIAKSLSKKKDERKHFRIKNLLVKPEEECMLKYSRIGIDSSGIDDAEAADAARKLRWKLINEEKEYHRGLYKNISKNALEEVYNLSKPIETPIYHHWKKFLKKKISKKSI